MSEGVEISDLREEGGFSFPAPPPGLTGRNLLGYLKFYGPGAIIASVTIGSGETVFASRGGAIFGYALLWCLVLGAILKGIQVYSGLRFITLTGYHPLASWRRLPGPKGWFPILIGVVTIASLPAVFAALPKFLATLVTSEETFASGSLSAAAMMNLVASGFLVFCALLALGASYRFMEWSQIIIVGLFLCFVLAAFFVFLPSIFTILKHVVVPAVPSYPAWVAEKYPTVASRPPWVEMITYIGAIGGGSYDYLGYLSFLRDKKWGMAGRLPKEAELPEKFPIPSAAQVARAKIWLRAPLTDALISFGMVVVFTMVFLTLGAAILFPAQQVPAQGEILTAQARFLTSLHPRLLPFYWAGIIMVFFGTVLGALEVHTRTLYECGRAIFPSLMRTEVRRFRTVLISFVLVTSLFLIWTDWDPLAIATPAAIVGGVFLCGLWCFAMLWTDHNHLPAAFQMNRTLRALTLLSGVVLTAFGVRGILDYFSGPNRKHHEWNKAER